VRPHLARDRFGTLHRGLVATISAVAVAAFAALPDAGGQTAKKASEHDQEINKPFVKPDVKAFIKRFESDTREVYAKRHAIVDSLSLKRGMYVADLGAGTGLFTRLFAEKVGPEGRVYAIDIAPEFLEHIAQEAKRSGQAQVRTIRGTQLTTGLSDRTIDLVFACDVYHHLENPERTLASVRRALRPGGRLVVIDFDKVKGKSSDFVQKHVRAEKAVFISEIQAAGFELDPVPNAPALKENFFLRFKKTSAPDADGPVGD
jgi:ubiquinone/menaquinone biosynthesis C-methylase UbiE